MAGGGNNVARMSPRQRMINLMYIVLTAMLALNVSSDVLNGFSLVHEGIHRTNLNMSARNEVQFRYLETLYAENPEQSAPFFNKGKGVRMKAEQLYSEIENLKMLIAEAADGKNANYHNIENNDDLEASSIIMLNPSTQRGQKLRQQIEQFRQYVVSVIPDANKKKSISNLLSTQVKDSKGDGMISWEQKMFDNMPAVAAVTLLAKLQNDIRQAESEALGAMILAQSKPGSIGELIANADLSGVRYNKFDAFVIPQSTMVMRGGKYSADIVLATIDSGRNPAVYVNGSRINNGHYEFTASSVGTHEFSGYIEALNAAGELTKYPFKSSYTVVEPMVTISPTLMNVIYAGIDNPISISVPGVPTESITATISSGSLTRNGNTWIARSTSVGSEVTISVSTNFNGQSMSVGSMKFRVRKLPDPTVYMPVGGGEYKGTPKRISKAALMAADGVRAAIDDNIINVAYSVVSFQTIFFDQMGNAIPENSNGSHFSDRQREQFKRLKPGARFFISNVKAKGPDGITRDISPMEVALN